MHLAGSWEGDQGHNVFGRQAATAAEADAMRYREKVTFTPVGPVDHDQQQLYGLEYKMAAWRIVANSDRRGDDLPFHTEVGYWMWSPERSQVTRTFVTPRGSAVLAAGPAGLDAERFIVQASADSDYGIVQNPFVFAGNRCVGYELSVALSADEFSYDETTTMVVVDMAEPLVHTDRNVLHRFEPIDLRDW